MHPLRWRIYVIEGLLLVFMLCTMFGAMYFRSNSQRFDPRTVVTSISTTFLEGITVETKKIFVYQNLTENQKMLLIPQAVCSRLVESELMFLDTISTDNSTYYHLKDILVSRVGGMVYNNTQFKVPYNSRHLKAKRGPIVGFYENVTFIGNAYGKMFGHWFKDTLCPLLLLPLDVQANSFIFIPGIPRIARETLEILGFDPSRTIVTQNDNDWIFARNFHTIVGSRPHLAHFSSTLIKLSQMFCKRLNLSSDPPCLYVLQNRNKGSRRSISNFRVFCEHVKKRFPKYDWEIWPPHFSTIRQAAPRWHMVKVMFCPTGSNVDNAIFMQPHSALCTVFGTWMDYPVIAVTQTLSIYQVIFDIPGWLHTKPSAGYLNIETALMFLGKAIYVVENHVWP